MAPKEKKNKYEVTTNSKLSNAQDVNKLHIKIDEISLSNILGLFKKLTTAFLV